MLSERTTAKHGQALFCRRGFIDELQGPSGATGYTARRIAVLKLVTAQVALRDLAVERIRRQDAEGACAST